LAETDTALRPAVPRAYNVKLLRLRLRLALLTMALLPTTLAVVLAHSTLDAQDYVDALATQDRSAAVAGMIDGELGRASSALSLLAADPALAEAARNAQTARVRLSPLLKHPIMGLRQVILADSSGSTVTAFGFDREGGSPREVQAPADLVPVTGLVSGSVVIGASHAGSEAVVTMAAPVGGPGSGGFLRLDISMAQLVDAARVRFAPHSDVLIVDRALGALLAEERQSADNAIDTRELLASLRSQSPNSLHWTVGDSLRVSSADLTAVPARWSLMVVDPVRPAQLPVLQVALLAVLTTMLVALVVWMSRQVMRPAQELAESREELLRLYETARTDALRDGLTGLGNHRAFQEELDNQLEWHRRYNVPFALILIDLDDLKVVNDTDGHAAGDELMREMGGLISSMTRYADRAFRIGGDEFALLMPHTTAEGALEFGRRLLARALEEPRRPIRFSGGISACPTLATTRDDLYAQADAALYWCKRHGRVSLDVFDPVRDRGTNDAGANGRAAHVARVISEGLVRSVYQPVVDLRTGVVIGYEGLTRPLPESGFADPGSLFAAAEAVGRTVELDHVCVETAVAHGGSVIAREQLLSVNLSPRTIEAPQFSIEWITDILERHGMDPGRLVIEVTEHQNIEDMPRLQRNLVALQKVGIRVAIDDVGAGNAGLRMLSQFRFDIVKVDLSLVQDGTRRDSSRAVLSSLRELAGRWGAYVVAEGLETVSQLRVVRELGLAAGQGYLLGRPMPTPNLRRIDLAAIEAGGVVLEARRLPAAEISPAQLPRPGAA
jgi:diguanylate cyclase (GGDEF)-like protein